MEFAPQPAPADSDKSIADYTERIRLTPRRISGRGIEGQWHLKLRRLYRGRGYLYEARGDYDEAIEDYSEVIKTFIQGRADYWSELVCDHFSRARACRSKGDYNGAIADYTTMIELYPQHVLAAGRVWVAAYFKIRGETYRDNGDYAKAIEISRRPLGLTPETCCQSPGVVRLFALMERRSVSERLCGNTDTH
jgi:tetratricopeptide (TPR) repeat protein